MIQNNPNIESDIGFIITAEYIPAGVSTYITKGLSFEIWYYDSYNRSKLWKYVPTADDIITPEESGEDVWQVKFPAEKQRWGGLHHIRVFIDTNVQFPNLYLGKQNVTFRNAFMLEDPLKPSSSDERTLIHGAVITEDNGLRVTLNMWPFVIADSDYNLPFVEIAKRKGIPSTNGVITTTQAASWYGYGELEIKDSRVRGVPYVITSFDGTETVKGWYKYFINCSELHISCPEISGHLDLHSCNHIKKVDISGCFVKRKRKVPPIAVTLGQKVTDANVGGAIFIKCTEGLIFKDYDGLVFDTNSVHGIEFDNCEF